MIFDKEAWAKLGKGFSVFDCAIRDRDNYYFVFVENKEDRETLPETRFLFVYADCQMSERFYVARYTNFGFTSVAWHGTQTRELVAMDTYGHTYSYDINRDDEENVIDTHWPTKEKRSAGITGLVKVDGQLYALGTERRIYRRKGLNNWAEIGIEGAGVPFPMARLKSGSVFDFGFNDMAGFSKEDMYAVGGVGDVWHFNGKKWQQVHFPANELLNTVCCAGDGNVYITGNNGSLWVGREDRWKRLAKGELSLAFKDSAWFAGRLYCGNDYGLWVLKDGKLKSLQDEVDSLVATSCGRIDISPDGLLMLTAGPHGATLFDGKKWEVLFNAFQLA